MVEKKKTKTVKKEEKTMNLSSYGSIVFGVGLLIVVVASFLSNLGDTSKTIIAATLIILGIVIGILNVTKRETIPFLLGTLVLVSMLQPFLVAVVQAFKITSPYILQVLGNLFASLMILVVPAAIVVALKVLFLIAKDE